MASRPKVSKKKKAKAKSKAKPKTQGGTTVSNFELEDNVEVPKVQRGGKQSKYPFAEMEVGQSFLIPEDELTDTMKKTANVGTLGNQWAKRNEVLNEDGELVRFIARRVEDGVRCWRVE